MHLFLHKKYQAISNKILCYLFHLLLISACSQETTVGLSSQLETTPEVELRVITSGGFAAAYNNLIQQIENDLGVSLHTEYGSSSGGDTNSIPVRLENGQGFDVIILSQESLNRLTEQAYVDADSRLDLVRSTIGMAVKEGAVVPDISTTESFIQVLMDAESIGYSASASGTYLSTVLFPEMGLWESLAPKSTRVLGERVATVVARGDVEIGFQQISEILPIAGITFAGPIPKELQRVTTFSAGILKSSAYPEYAQRLLDYLSSEDLAPAIAEAGLAPVVLENKANEH